MSHFTKVATKINDLDALSRALDALHWEYRRDAAGVSVRGYQGDTRKAELAIQMGRYDIGAVKQDDGCYAFEADWWGVEQAGRGSEAKILEQINQGYAYQRVVAAVEEQGYSVDTNEVQSDGSRKLTVSRWS